MSKFKFDMEEEEWRKVSIRNQIETKEMESNRADLQKLANLPTRFTKTASGDNWLILNTVQDQNKELIIGFVSPAQLALMKSSPTWYCDGTFDCVLAMKYFNQVWIIVANTPVGVSVPVAFFLTERRTEDTYQQILTTLRDKYGVTGLCQPQPALPDEDCKGHLYGWHLLHCVRDRRCPPTL